MTPTRRTWIGASSGLFERQRVFAFAGGLEVDEPGLQPTRRRVLFDEVLLVTYHRYFGWVFLTFMALFALVCLGSAAVAALDGDGATATVFAASSWFFVILFVLRLVFRVDVVTVYGRRTKAVTKFSFRKRRAREVFDWVCEQARRAQGGDAAEERPGPAAGGPGYATPPG